MFRVAAPESGSGIPCLGLKRSLPNLLDLCVRQLVVHDEAVLSVVLPYLNDMPY